MSIERLIAPLLAVALASAAEGAQRPAKASPPARSMAAADRVAVRLLDFASVRRLFGAIARQRQAMNEGERVGAWTDFTLMAAAVVGDTRLDSFTFDRLATATSEAPRVLAADAYPCTRSTRRAA